MKNFRITLDGRVHRVTVEVLDGGPAVPERPAVPAPAAPAASAVRPAAPPPPVGGEVRSPLTGKLVSLDVKVGQQVEEGAQVATIEAMKMNTYVFAPRSGPVSALLATPGQAVEENDPLLVID